MDQPTAKPIPLSTRLGEVVAPQTLLTALVLRPDGDLELDPGALHGRSELERNLQWVQKRELVSEGQVFRIIWVAVELDSANAPVRYKGLSVCDVVANAEKRLGYKNLAEHVNRMSEAIRGGVNCGTLTPLHRRAVKSRLIELNQEAWERTASQFKEALR